MDHGGGALAASCLEQAASVVARAARDTTGWSGGRGAAAQAEALRRRARRLGEENACAYAAAREALDGGLRDDPQEARDHQLGAAVQQAAASPHALALLGADIATLADHLAPHVEGHRAADLAAAASIAAGASAAAAHLVAGNLAVAPGDARLAAARHAAERAQTLACAALAFGH